jgi:Pyruvate/2-oxoacid:ferredoxin oxidoreductase delta subunit
MGGMDLAMHYVCTHDQARRLIKAHEEFWVSNCGCRESKANCKRSRMDVCLIFDPADPGSGTGKHEITRAEADALVKEADDHYLVTRPWRNADRTRTDGICFCCDDCCGYFSDPNERCDKGDLRQKTDMDECIQCGVCVDLCYFHARVMVDDELRVTEDNCYGCGLCVPVCPVQCIEMVAAGEAVS